MHTSSVSHKARPRTLEPKRNQVSLAETSPATAKAQTKDVLESPSFRLWERPRNLPTSSETKPWNLSIKNNNIPRNVLAQQTPYRAATIEFFAKPLSTVSWIPLAEEARNRHLDNHNSLLAIGSCLGDGGDWIRLVRLQVSEIDGKSEEEASTELSLNTVTTTRVGDVISSFCPYNSVSSNSPTNNVLLFYGTLQGQVCGLELSLEEPERNARRLSCKLSSPYVPNEAIVGLTQLPFWNQLVAATNLGKLRIYQVSNQLESLSLVESSDAFEREISEPVSFTDICTVSETMLAVSGITGSVCCFDIRSSFKESQRLSIGASGISCTCVCVDSGQPNYIFAGTSQGELVAWDRRIVRESQAPLFRIAAHHGRVSRVGVSPVWNPGVAFTSGKNDCQVLSWDFASAAQMETTFGRRYKDAYSCWEANIQKEQVRNIARDSVFSLNDMDLHPTAPLVAYVSSSSSLNVVCL